MGHSQECFYNLTTYCVDYCSLTQGVEPRRNTMHACLKFTYTSSLSSRAQKCVTPIIAYGHYPLGTIAHPDTRPWWQPDPPASDSTLDSSKDPLVVSLQGMTVQSVLEKNGAQMYLCGHLHALFGSRLHRLHPRSNSSGVLQIVLHGSEGSTVRGYFLT